MVSIFSFFFNFAVQFLTVLAKFTNLWIIFWILFIYNFYISTRNIVFQSRRNIIFKNYFIFQSTLANAENLEGGKKSIWNYPRRESLKCLVLSGKVWCTINSSEICRHAILTRSLASSPRIWKEPAENCTKKLRHFSFIQSNKPNDSVAFRLLITTAAALN